MKSWKLSFFFLLLKRNGNWFEGGKFKRILKGNINIKNKVFKKHYCFTSVERVFWTFQSYFRFCLRGNRTIRMKCVGKKLSEEVVGFSVGITKTHKKNIKQNNQMEKLKKTELKKSLWTRKVVKFIGSVTSFLYKH